MPKLKSSPDRVPRRNRLLRLLLWLLAGLVVTLVAERWRGQWTLRGWKTEMRAKGEIFEVERLWPPASQANSEFSNRLAQAIGVLRGELADYAGQLFGIIEEQPGSYRRGSQQPRPPRLRNDDVTNTWQNLDELIQQNQSSLQSLRELMKDPPATMGRDIVKCLELESIPNFVGVRVGAQTMQAVAMNDLHKGDHEMALQDLGTLLSFAKLYEQDPSLVNYMIRMAVIGLSIDVCWDALQADGWTEPQLATLQQECLDSGRMLPQMARAMESERAGRLYGWQLFRSHSYQQWLARYQELYAGFGLTSPAADAATPVRLWRQWVFHPLWTFAWADQEELEYLRQTQMEVESMREAARERSWMRLKEQMTAQHQNYRAPATAWRFYGSLPMVDRLSVVIGSNKIPEPAYPYPDFTRAWFTSLKNLTQHQMAIAAIALKRYALRHGQPPANLAALVTEFLATLPTDLMDGQPIRYRLNADGTFDLYSVGENLKDDGGDFSSEFADDRWHEPSPWNGRDWVWPKRGADGRSESGKVGG